PISRGYAPRDLRLRVGRETASSATQHRQPPAHSPWWIPRQGFTGSLFLGRIRFGRDPVLGPAKSESAERPCGPGSVLPRGRQPWLLAGWRLAGQREGRRGRLLRLLGPRTSGVPKRPRAPCRGALLGTPWRISPSLRDRAHGKQSQAHAPD